MTGFGGDGVVELLRGPADPFSSAMSASAGRDMAWRCVWERAVATTMMGFGDDSVV